MPTGDRRISRRSRWLAVGSRTNSRTRTKTGHGEGRRRLWCLPGPDSIGLASLSSALVKLMSSVEIVSSTQAHQLNGTDRLPPGWQRVTCKFGRSDPSVSVHQDCSYLFRKARKNTSLKVVTGFLVWQTDRGIPKRGNAPRLDETRRSSRVSTIPPHGKWYRT